MSKLYRARSLQYRRQILQANIRWKALDEIYKIYIYASLGEKNRIENEIMKMYTNKKYSTEKAEYFCTAQISKFTPKIVNIFSRKQN